MPTYEYECTKCKHTFERLQSMSDKPVKTCPKCKKVVRRIIGFGAGILFKGSGFYATDYRKPAYKEKEKQDKPDKPDKPASCKGPSKECASCPKAAENKK